ncbi:MAG: DUF4139 domain-containing protein [Gammaproteobacteria bacterium]
MSIIRILPLVTLLGAWQSTIAAPASEGDAITIYSTSAPGAISPDYYRPVAGHQPNFNIPGYAVVRHDRIMSLLEGRSSLLFTDVAALIDPTTVGFKSLTDPEHTRVIEQNFQFDLVNASKLMEKYIDQTITIDQVLGDEIRELAGTLLSVDGGLVLRDSEGRIHAVRHYANVRFPELPGGLITRPTLQWDIDARRGGTHHTRVSYQTGGMTWWTDYNLVFTEGKTANSGWLDVGAWVSIINRSGAGFENASLKLIAGDVHRATTPGAASGAMKRHAAMEMAMDQSVAGFDEKSFFEFHLYTLGRPTTLPNNSTKQIELFPVARRVPAEKVMVYYGLAPTYYGFFPDPVTDRNYGTQSNKKVDIYLKFKNDERHGLGVPLPAGRMRVSKTDSDGSLEFIGEDVIDHTPKQEDILIKLGSAFDIVGERKQTDFRVDVGEHWIEEEIEITLRNHKDEPVTVVVKENLYRWVNWSLLSHSHRYEKKDARTIHFPVRIAADEEATVRYRVRYTW